MGSRSSKTATVNDTYDAAAHRVRHRDAAPVMVQTIATYDEQLRRVIDACHVLDMLPHDVIGIVINYCRVSGHAIIATGGHSHNSSMSHSYVYGSVGDGPPPGSVPSSWCIMNGLRAQTNVVSVTHVYESCGYIYNAWNVDVKQLEVTMYESSSLRPSPSSSSSGTSGYQGRSVPRAPSSLLPTIAWHGTDYLFAALAGSFHVFASPSRPIHGGAATGTAYHLQYDHHSTRWSSCTVAPAAHHNMSPILVVAVEDHDKVHSAAITSDTGGFDLQNIGMASSRGHDHGYIYGICMIHDGYPPSMMQYDPLLGTWHHVGTAAPCHIPSSSRMIYRRHAHDILILATNDSVTKYPSILRFALHTNTWHSLTHEKVPRFLRSSGTAMVYIPTNGALMVAGGGDRRDQPDTFSDAVYILDDQHMKKDNVIWTRVSTLPSAQWGMAMIVL